MPDEAVVREKARNAVQEGKLPARAPDRVWGGPGVDAPCSVCEVPIPKSEMEFEVQFAVDGHGGGGELDKFPSPPPMLCGVGVRAPCVRLNTWP
jgi:hypothetical protein